MAQPQIYTPPLVCCRKCTSRQFDRYPRAGIQSW